MLWGAQNLFDLCFVNATFPCWERNNWFWYLHWTWSGSGATVIVTVGVYILFKAHFRGYLQRWVTQSSFSSYSFNLFFFFFGIELYVGDNLRLWKGVWRTNNI